MELVRFSDLSTKEIINLSDGMCLGVFADCDLKIDPDTGKVLELILTSGGGAFSFFWGSSQTYIIPWEAVARIGVDTIIVSFPEDQ